MGTTFERLEVQATILLVRVACRWLAGQAGQVRSTVVRRLRCRLALETPDSRRATGSRVPLRTHGGRVQKWARLVIGLANAPFSGSDRSEGSYASQLSENHAGEQEIDSPFPHRAQSIAAAAQTYCPPAHPISAAAQAISIVAHSISAFILGPGCSCRQGKKKGGKSTFFFPRLLRRCALALGFRPLPSWEETARTSQPGSAPTQGRGLRPEPWPHPALAHKGLALAAVRTAI
jgi:hypothetical protein